MSYIPIDISIMGTVLSVSIALMSIYLTIQKTSKEDFKILKEDSVELEHRLTVLEQSQFSNEDRKCLNILATKIDLFYETIRQEIPDLLKHEDT